MFIGVKLDVSRDYSVSMSACWREDGIAWMKVFIEVDWETFAISLLLVAKRPEGGLYFGG